MDLLARREHAFQELVDKLLRRFSDREMVKQQVHLLADENLQSDLRYAETFIRSKIHKYHGPQRIKAELRERGVDESLYNRVLNDSPVDWQGLLIELYENRYGDRPIEDAREKAKRMRFLQYRGFSFDQIKTVL